MNKLPSLILNNSPSISSSPNSSIMAIDDEDTRNLEKLIFSAINDGNQEKLAELFDIENTNSTEVLQLLMTIAYPNDDDFYKFDDEDKMEADEFLGQRYIRSI
jgi:hypothetical protein